MGSKGNKHFAGEAVTMPEGFSLEALRTEWGARLALFSPESSPVKVWDSFEWQLWHENLVLWSSHGVVHLCRREGGWIGPELIRGEMPRNTPRFGSDFKSPALRERLAPLLGLRGLAPVGDAVFKRRMAELQNEVGKIVCRFESLEISRAPQSRPLLAGYCRVLPLRGYESAAREAAGVLGQHGAQPCEKGPLAVVLNASGRIPSTYTLRPKFGLHGTMPARVAIGKIVRAMLELARENEARIPDDVDTEFLHDYRICLRKIRSVLSLVKGVYPEAETVELRKILGKLARETNRLRDLDVYLLSRSNYTDLLPKELQGALDEMFQEFESERAEQKLKVARRLKSAAHRHCVRQLETFFGTDTFHEPTAHAETPIAELVFERIYKRYRKIRRSARGLEADAGDEAVHGIRIECKKLRYLMEFFAEIIPLGSLETEEKQIRQLQNKLGAFNDSSVQQASLMEYWHKKRGDSGDQSALALSLGGLISILHDHHRGHREKVLRALAEFCSGPTAALFEKVFKHPKRGTGLPQDPPVKRVH